MGWNTTIVVHNDALGEIRDDPEFGKTLHDAVLHLQVEKGPLAVRAGNHVNAAEAIESHHADIIQLVAVGANMAWVMPGSVLRMVHFDVEEMKQEILEDLADKMGYRLVKKNKKGL